MWTTPLEYHLFAASQQQKAPRDALPEPPAAKRTAQAKKAQTAKAERTAARATTLAAKPSTNTRQFEVVYQWSQALPMQVRAMVLTPESLFIAGPADVLDEEDAFARITDAGVQARILEQEAVLAGKKGFSLWAVGLSDGRRLAEYQLESLPVFDGMIAAAGRLYMVTSDGKVHCFQPM